MVVGSWPAIPSSTFQYEFIRMLRETFKENVGKKQRGNACDVLVRGLRGSAERLTFGECEQWFREYLLPLSTINVAATPPDEVESASLFLIRISPPQGGWLESDDAYQGGADE
jgi:hypothetical protein